MIALLLVVLINFVGIGALIPVIPYTVVDEFGYSETIMSALLASFSLAMFLSNPVLGRLSDQFGRRRLLIIALALNTVAHLWFALSEDIVSLFAARILAGIGAGNIGIIQAMLVERSKTEDRARIMGLLGAAIGAGFVLGPALGGLFSGLGGGPVHQVPFFIAAGFGAIAMILCLRLPARPAQASAQPAAAEHASAPIEKTALLPRLLQLMAGPLGWFALAFFLLNLSFAQVEASFVLLVKDLMGFTARDTGWLFTYIGVCIIVVQGGLIGVLVKRLGEMTVILLGAGALCGGQFLTVLFARYGMDFSLPMLAQLVILTTIICVGFALTNPTLSAASSRVAKTEDMGGALGLVQGFGSLGQVFGLILAGPLYEMGGGMANYGFGGIITLGLLIVAYQLLAKLYRPAAS